MDIVYSSTFEQISPGSANDVGVGANGTVWIVSNTPVPGGYEIRRWTGSGWTTIPGGAVRIAVDPSGNAWVVNNANLIYRWDGSNWQGQPDTATDIGIGANGSVWMIGTANVPGGHPVKRWNGAGWTQIDGEALRIAVDPNGNPWVTDVWGSIYRRNGGVSGSWQVMGGTAKDIGIGADGMVWVVGTSAVGGGYQVYRWSGINWLAAPGGALQISVGPAGKAWLVNSSHDIFRWK